jgi:hypothetical protein
VPAPWSAAPTALAPAHPQPMAPRTAGARAQVWPAPAGGVPPRWGRLASAPRQAPAPRPVGPPRLQDRHAAGHGVKPRGRPRVAGDAEARQARSPCVHGGPATGLSPVPVRRPRGAGPRGRPRPDAPPVRVVATSAGARAAAVAPRQARLAPPRGVILATHAREAALGSPPAGRPGDTGQAQAARGGRCRNAPPWWAASCARHPPARLRALGLVRPGGLVVEAALASRLRPARRAHGATVPAHTGHPTQTPTARGGCPDVGGMHGRRIPGPWDDLVGPLTAAHPSRHRLLGTPSERWSRGIGTNTNGAMRNGGSIRI